METRKIFLATIIILIFGVNAANSQDTKNLKTSEIFDAPLIGRNYVPPQTGKGSPYLYDKWLKGHVVFISGDTVKNKLFKFDCLKNEFIWMADGKSKVALDHNLINSFTIYSYDRYGERKFEKTALKIPFLSDSLFRYIEVLAKGGINLYSYRRIEVNREETPGKSGGIYQLNSYSHAPFYFIQIANLPVKQIRFSKKTIYEGFPEYKDKVKKIIRANHIGGIRNEFQLINLIRLINEKWED